MFFQSSGDFFMADSSRIDLAEQITHVYSLVEVSFDKVMFLDSDALFGISNSG